MRERAILAAFKVLEFFFRRPIDWVIKKLEDAGLGWGD